MFAGRNGAEIQALYQGRTDLHRGDHSAADQALANHLAFWCAGNLSRMDRMFRQSGLMREKWDEARRDSTYGRDTLLEALAGTREHYEPSIPISIEEEAAVEHREGLQAALKAVEGLSERLKADSSWPFTEEGREALGILRALDPVAWQRAKTAIGKVRTISLRELERRLPPVSKYLPSTEGGTERRAGDTITDCPSPAIIIPSPYYANDREIGRYVSDEQGRQRPRSIVSATILVCGTVRDSATGLEHLVIKWRWPGGPWHTRLVERAQALSSRRIMDLAAFGFPVYDENAKDLVAYLGRMEAANRITLPVARVTSHLGWQGPIEDDAPFLCGQTAIYADGSSERVSALDIERPEDWTTRRICFHGDEGQMQIVSAFEPKGTFKEWLEAVSILTQYPAVLFVFYAGFAAPLLEVTKCPNFIVSLDHDTTLGKTSAIRTVASQWGNPDERSPSSVILSWNASRVGIERNASVISGTPLLADDTKTAKPPKIVPEIIYQVVGGRGRVRGTLKGIAVTSYWRTILFSTGEEPITSYTQDGGTRTRTLALSGMPFGGKSDELRKIIDALNAVLRENYGHAGPMFVSWLQRRRERWPEWRERFAHLTDVYAKLTDVPEAGRMASYVALVQVAAEMAHQALPLPWEFSSHQNCIRELWPSLATGAADAAGAERALEDVYSWACSNQERFIGQAGYDAFKGEDRRPPSTLGRWDGSEEWEYLAIHSVVLKEFLASHSYIYETIVRSWRDRGWTECQKDRMTSQVPLGSGTRTGTMVKILRAAIDRITEEK